MTVSNHPVYENPPVALVVAEIKFPGEIGGTVPPAMRRALSDVLGEDWVIEQLPTVSVNVGSPQAYATGFSPNAILRFATRDRTSAVALTGGSATVETTRYRDWPQFRSILEKTVQAVEKLLRPAGTVRVGVRYVNEVRVGARDGEDWVGWLPPALLPPATQTLADAGWVPLNWAGAAQYRIGTEHRLVLHYGPQTADFIVNPDGPLRRHGPRPHGPFFLLDFDAYWEPSAVPAWDGAGVLETCDQLHEPIQVLFDELVTDRLVAEVFGRKENALWMASISLAAARPRRRTFDWTPAFSYRRRRPSRSLPAT
jgi:uncharacterized protein (TIGR04255 family)